MDSHDDHGNGAKPRQGEGNKRSSVSSAQHDRTTVSIHPVLKALVQLMAREEAAAYLGAPSDDSFNAEGTPYDQNHQVQKD
jgi:hypothetical protein